MSLTRKQLLIVLLVSALFFAVSLADSAAEEDLGTEQSETIETGFFFYNGQYIEAPYVVERRGVDIYVNGQLVRTGPEYPPFDPRVDEDPGDPPAGESPYKPVIPDNYRDTYWARKWRYLATHYDIKTEGGEKMVEALQKSPLVKNATRDPNDWSTIRIVMKSGKEFNLFIDPIPGCLDAPPTKEEFVQKAQKSQGFYELMLDRNIALFAKPGREVYVQGKRAVEALEILTSDMSEEEKVKALTELEVVEPGLEDMVYTFRATPQLAQRLEKLKADMARQKQMADVKAEISTILEQVEAQNLLTDPADLTAEPYIPPPPTTQPGKEKVELSKNAALHMDKKAEDSSMLLWVTVGLGVVVVVQFVLLIGLSVMLFRVMKKLNR